MTDIVERVARAICLNGGLNPDRKMGVNGAGGSCWELYEDSARAAIAAMREPTEDMINAGYEQDENAAANGLAILPEAYTAMIDAALNTGTDPKG